MSVASTPFARLVSALKRSKSTVSVVESCCGGLIQSSILAQPGASAVYWGGTIAYNTRRSKALLLNDDKLHSSLTAPFDAGVELGEAEWYVASKVDWTARTSAAYCEQVGTTYAIAEGGAAGPTFRPKDLDRGFAALAVAARDADTGEVRVVRDKVVRSRHADREKNMRLFADEAAKLALEVVVADGGGEEAVDDDFAALPPAPAPFFDRATHLRSDPDALEALAPEAKYVALRDGSAIFRPGLSRLALLTLDEVRTLADAAGATTETSFLGLTDSGAGPAAFGVDLLGGDEDKLKAVVSAMERREDDPEPPSFSDVRTGAPLLSPDHNELALHSMALAQWQRRAKFCTLCGSPAPLVDGGTARKCSGCGAMSWPRQDPSMIALVSSRDGERALLGRSKRHAPKLHTALAGFVEAGETFEHAVAREAYEETGVRVDVDSVSYVGSQPWPFPQSAMIGFIARADDRQELNIDTNELVEAAWFDRETVERAAEVEGPVMRWDVAERVLKEDPSLELLIPPRGVLARTLIEAWLNER